MDLVQLIAALSRGSKTVELLQNIATLCRISSRRESCNTPPHSLGVVGTGTHAEHCHTASGQ